MSLSEMVEIPRLQAKRRFVMPRRPASRGGDGWETRKAWIPAFAGKTKGKQSTSSRRQQNPSAYSRGLFNSKNFLGNATVIQQFKKGLGPVSAGMTT